MTKQIETITIHEYAKRVGLIDDNPTIEKVQNYAEDNDLTLWDYPMVELDYVLTEVNDSVVFVKENGEVRICEI